VNQALQFWALALVGHSALEVVNRLFYAQKDAVTPLWGALVGMVINLTLAVGLYRPLDAGGLALANAVAVTVEVLILLVIANRRMGGMESGVMLTTLLRTLLAATGMALGVWGFVTFVPNLPPLLVAVIGGGLGVLIYAAAGLALGLEEIRWLPRLVGR
jgi:putative peptidoglycan lipid II flippase